jgi:predicted unusual protein kinase regulating ubiquinone biosynthesis (AarF/ABC1/UbiB family)
MSLVLHLVLLVSMQLTIASSYLWLFVRTKLLRWRLSPEALAELHRRNGRRFVTTASRLKGANVKLGQMASMQGHLLPKEVIEELKHLRDAVKPTEYARVAEVLRAELGKPPGEVFAEFDEVPVAAASMAQVHIARLKTGEKVAVKVLHPGLEQGVEIDLFLMRVLLTIVGLFYRKIDLKQVLLENEEPLRLELNLVEEGKATDALAVEIRPLGVLVPKVYWQHTSRRVITLEFIEGVNIDKIARMTEWNIDRRALADSFGRAMLHQTYGIGYFHADPHPGNLICTREGKLAMLDFGMVKRLPEHVRVGLTKEIFGAFFGIPSMYADGLIQKGAIGEPDRKTVEAFATLKLGDPKIRAVLFDHKVDDHGEATAAIGSIVDMIDGLETFQTPLDNMMFMRSLGITIDVCKEIVPEVPMSELIAPLMMPMLAGLMATHPEYGEAVMKAMAASAASAGALGSA